MGTVKYTGPVASFHCPTNAEIRSLKVHFSPKQDGSGDPSPENVRPISGWTGVDVYKSGKNLVNISNDNIIYQNFSQLTDGSYYQISGNTVTLYNPNAKSLMVCFAVTPITSQMVGMSFILNANTTGNGDYGIFLSNLDGSNRTSNRVNPYTIASGDVGKLIGARVRMNNTSGIYTVSNIQFEFGSTATSYEPYQGTTTNYEFGVLGKNKFNYSNANIKDKYRLDDNGNEVTDSSGSYCQIMIPVIPNIEYTLSGYTANNVSKRIYYFTKDGNFISRSAAFGNDSYTFTIPSNCYFIQIQNREVSNAGWDTLQLELGSIATAYEPYDPKHTVYGGWVDLISGEVCEEWINFPLTSSLNWNKANRNSSGIYFYYENSKAGEQCLWSAGQYSLINAREKYTHGKVENPWSEVSNNAWAYWATNNTTIRLSYSDDMNILSVDDLKDWLDEQENVSICYPLGTPIHYFIAPTGLQTFLGQNNVWSNADYVEVEYDLHETQDILARKQFIIANQPHVVTPAAASLQNFTTDVVAPLKECKVDFKPIQDLHGYDRPWIGGSGKNLFNINAPYAEPSDITSANTTNRIFTAGTHFIGIASNNYINKNAITNASINDTTISVTATSGYGYGFALKLTPGQTYYLSGTSSSSASFTYYNSNGEVISYQGARLNKATTIPENTDITLLTFASSGGETITWSNIQLELGSTATSYEPYENVCPISGWTGIETYRTRKNIGVFLVNSFTNNANTYYNGNSSWCSQSNRYSSLQGLEITYSAFIDATNVSGSNFNAVKIWGKKKDGNWAFLARSGNNISLGSSGISSVTITIPADLDWIVFGLGLEPGATASNPMVEVGSTATSYESYSGTTIPITFPATTNLFNEQWEQGNIEVGNDAGSSTCMRTGFIDVNSSTSYYLYTPRENNVFVFEYLEDGTYANKVNSVYTSHTFTTGSTTKKIRIVDRNSGTETVNTGINYPATITYYEPYGTIYGGYIDLIEGKLYQEWKKIIIDETYFTSIESGEKSVRRVQYRSDTDLHTETPWVDSNGQQKIFLMNYIKSSTQTSTPWTGYFYGNTLNLRVDGTSITSKQDWLDYIAEHHLELVYKLATPIEYQLTPQTLKTLRGQNNIWSNAGDVSVSYWTH